MATPPQPWTRIAGTWPAEGALDPAASQPAWSRPGASAAERVRGRARPRQEAQAAAVPAAGLRTGVGRRGRRRDYGHVLAGAGLPYQRLSWPNSWIESAATL
jgi:hypothetical protein